MKKMPMPEVTRSEKRLPKKQDQQERHGHQAGDDPDVRQHEGLGRSDHGSRSALHQIDVVDVDAAAVAVEHQHQGQADADLGGGDGDHEQGEHLAR